MTINPEIGLDEFLAQKTAEFESARRTEFFNLVERVDALEDVPTSEPTPPFDPSGLEESITTLGQRVQTLEEAPAPVIPEPFDPSSINEELATVSTRIQTLEDNPPPAYDPTELRAILDDIALRVQALEQASTGGTSNPLQYAIDLATIGGINDEERRDRGVTKALETGRPMILPFQRAFTPVNPMTMFGKGNPEYEGAFRLYGAFPWVGNQNLEQGTKKVLSWIEPGSGVGVEEKSLFVNPGTIYDMHLEGFAVQGDSGGPTKGLMYGPYTALPGTPSRNLYRCSAKNIGMNFMAHGFGSTKNPLAMTCVSLLGNFEYLNNWPGFGGFITAGGSDVLIDAHLNAGPSRSPLQAGRVVNGVRLDWLIDISYMAKTKIDGELFLTANNGWGALRVRGPRTSTYGLDIQGIIAEGYKPTGSAESGPAHGTLVLIEGGVGSLSRCSIGQGMARPTPNEQSVFEVRGGDWSISDITMYQGDGAPGSRLQHTPYFSPNAKVETFGIKYREAA